MYVCYNCSAEIVGKPGDYIEFCSNCSGRVLFKTVPKTVRTVQTD